MNRSLFPDAQTSELNEERALIALSLVPGVGPGRIRALLARFGTAVEALTASRVELETVSGFGPQTAQAVASFSDMDAVDRQVELAEKSDTQMITCWDPRYPKILRQIDDPPVFFWLRGVLDEADEQSLAIVGTRKATEYGKQVAYDFASELARNGFTIVSGLAYGIDASAHRGALDSGGRTIAVLGSGADRIYPAHHMTLARSILEQGAILSEYPMGAAPEAPNFPRRNRIISGLSLGTLVVEAFASGGALITAGLALEQNREVFAIPHSIYARGSEGCNRFIQRGFAKLVLSPEDILNELGMTVHRDQGIDDREQAVGQLNDLERSLYDHLSDEPVYIDILCEQTGLDSSTALVYLLSLEFKGLIRQMAGRQFLRT